jgi:hypothetical protein
MDSDHCWACFKMQRLRIELEKGSIDTHREPRSSVGVHNSGGTH